jgi:hypothetical protein
VGIDFLKKTAPSFHRALDRRAVELRTPTLFSDDVPTVSRTACAELRDGATMTIGEHALLRIVGDKLVVQRDNFVVAEFPSAPGDFLARVQSGAGVEIGEVMAVRSISGEVEISLCD